MELIRSAKKRGYVTHDQINALLSSDEVKSEQIEDIQAKLSEMGVSLEAELEEEVATREEPEEEAEGENELVPLHSDYDFFGLGLAEGSGLWVGAAHFGASFVGCEHPFDASA